LPRGNSGRRSIAYFISAPFEGFGFCFPGTAQSGAEKANALPGGRTAALPLAPSRAIDAVHKHNVANVTDRDRPSTLSIVWSADGCKCALLINGYPHAAFDFAAKRGYCRTNFPNETEGSWSKSDHSWSDDAIAWLGLKGRSRFDLSTARFSTCT